MPRLDVIPAYGRFLAAHPWAASLVLLSVVVMHVALICSARLWAVPLVTDVSKLWIDPASQVAKNDLVVQTYNPPALNTYTELYTLGTKADDMAAPANLRAWIALSRAVMGINVTLGNSTFNTLDVCDGRLSQSPYVYGCNVVTSADYFREGGFATPHAAAAQYLIDTKYNGSWAFALSADALLGTTFVQDTLRAECGKRISLADCTAVNKSSSVISSAAAVLQKYPLALLLLAVNASTRDAAWRRALANDSFVDRHLTRPSLEQAPLDTLSRPGPDLLTQDLQPLIFGGRVPAQPRPGACACGAGWAGLQCAVKYDPLCTCDATFKSSCINAIFQGCLPYASCASVASIEFLYAKGPLVAPSVSFARFANYAARVQVRAGFELDQPRALDQVFAACGQPGIAAWQGPYLARAAGEMNASAAVQATALRGGAVQLSLGEFAALRACLNASSWTDCQAVRVQANVSSACAAPTQNATLGTYFACLAMRGTFSPAQADLRAACDRAAAGRNASACVSALQTASAWKAATGYAAYEAATGALATAAMAANISFPWISQANENTVLSRACASAKTNVPAASIQSQDCDVLLTQVQGALTLQAAAITRISLALAKYGFLGALNGACKQTLGSQDGGGACWADADCGSNGTCAGLGESVKLASVSTLAAALFTASGEAVQARLASGEAARYRALATGLPGALNLSLADAQQVVYLWRRELEAVVQAFDTARATVLASDGPEVLLSQFSSAQIPVLIGGYVLMALASKDWRVKSRGVLGVACVVLVSLSVAGGLSIGVLAGIPFSAAATQILPYLMLGLGVDSFFVIIRNYPLHRQGLSAADAAAQGLSVSIPVVLVMGLTNAGVFAIGNLALMPVVTNMASQAAIVVLTNLFTVVTCTPVLAGLDYARQARRMADLACCAPAAPPDDAEPTNLVQRACVPRYRALVVTRAFRAFSLALMLALVVAGACGVAFAAQLGLSFADVAPPGSMLARALALRDAEFPFYGATLVTTEADYSSQAVQQAIPRLYTQVMNTSKLVPGSGYAWMLPFMAWAVPSTPVYNLSAPGGICSPDSPTTQGNCGLKFGCQVVTNDSSILAGAIPFFPPADFYRCLEAWINSDLVYEVLKPGFVLRDPAAPKGSRKLALSEPENSMPFTRGDVICEALTQTSDFVRLIDDISAVTANYSDPGAFAFGAAIDFYYQYVTISQVILDAVGFAMLVCFAASFAVIAIVVQVGPWPRRLLAAVWAAAVITGVVCMAVFEIYGFMAYAGIKVSAVPGISIIMSAAVGVDVCVPISVAFVVARGSRLQRVSEALHVMCLPVIDGLFSTFCGILFISASPFAFIVKYFFLPYLIIIVFAAINGLIVLPLLLGVMGPFELDGTNDGAAAALEPKDQTAHVEPTQDAKTDKAEEEVNVEQRQLERV